MRDEGEGRQEERRKDKDKRRQRISVTEGKEVKHEGAKEGGSKE